MIAKREASHIVNLRGVPQMSERVRSALIERDCFGRELDEEIVAEADRTIVAATAEIQRRVMAKMVRRGEGKRQLQAERNAYRGPITIPSFDEEDYDDAA